MRDEALPQHFFRIRFDFIEAAGQFDAACFTATAGVHLRFDDPQIATERLCRLAGLGGACRYPTIRHRNAILGKQ